MRVIAMEDHPTYRAANPTKWKESTDYLTLDFATSFRAYMRQRAELVRFLSGLPDKAWSRTALVTGAGSPRNRTLHPYAMWLANHERSHLRQIAKLAADRRQKSGGGGRRKPSRT